MSSTYTDSLRVELQADGENTGTWGSIANKQFQVLEQGIAGYATITFSSDADYTLTTANGDISGDEARNMILNIANGTITQARSVIVPQQEKMYVVKNNNTYDVTIKPSGQSGVTVPAGYVSFMYCDGTDVVNAITALPSGTLIGGTAVVTLTGTQTLTNKTLTSAILTTPKIPDTSADNYYIFAVNELTANRNITLPLLTADDTFVFADFIQTLTNKTLSSPTLNSATISGGTIDNVSIGSSTAATQASIDNLKLDGNTFSSTDTNGDINITPNGTGAVNLQDKTLQRPKILDYGETVNTIGDFGGGTQDIDLESGNVVSATVSTSTVTFTFSNPPATGICGSFGFIVTNGGSQTINWPASVNWVSGTAPTLTTSGVDVLVFFTLDAGTNWYGFVSGLDMS